MMAEDATPQSSTAGRLGRAQACAAGVCVLAFWAFIAFIYMPCVRVALLLVPQPGRRALGQDALRWLFVTVARILRKFGVVEVTYQGFDRLKAHVGPVILAPNHPALWDAVFILAEMERVACVLKASLMRNPLLVVGSRAAGFIPNEPSHKMLRRCIDLLRGGERLLFFPEGTRTRPENGCVNPLSGGLTVIARNSGAPVWPIYIQTSGGYLGKGWPIWRLPTETIRLRITAGDPLWYQHGEDSAAFLERLRACYQASGCGPQAGQPR